MTYGFGGAVHAKCLRARLVADVPCEHVIHPVHHFLLGDLVLHDSGGVGLAPILVGRVHSILDWLQ
jgi:hypothetical protein